jgi:hypothetical protein
MRIYLSLLGLALCCAQAVADEVDLSFNADAARLQYMRDLRSLTLNLDAGWLHHTDNGNVVHAGLHLADMASGGNNPLKAGLGGRLVYTNGDLSDQDGFAVPIGGYLRYTPQRFNRVSIAGQVYFAPNVLSLGDMEKYEEYTFRVGYNLMREADIYIGARYVKGEYKKARDARYDTGMNMGITLRF